jgi:hypothetical protein
MSADANRIDYWTPATPLPAQAASMFTGPERVGCVTMVVVVIAASLLAVAIVTGLGWVLT